MAFNDDIIKMSAEHAEMKILIRQMGDIIRSLDPARDFSEYWLMDGNMPDGSDNYVPALDRIIYY